MAKTALRVVPPLEDNLPLRSWGDEFAACRKRSRYTTNAAITTELKAVGLKVSTATISRLEDAEDTPTLLTQRIIATAAMIFYGRSPALLGLSVEELPPVTFDAIVARLTGPEPGGDVATAAKRCTAPESRVRELATITPLRWTQPELEELAA